MAPEFICVCFPACTPNGSIAALELVDVAVKPPSASKSLPTVTLSSNVLLPPNDCVVVDTSPICDAVAGGRFMFTVDVALVTLIAAALFVTASVK